MHTRAYKTQEHKNQSHANGGSQMQIGGESTFQFVDNRPEVVAQRKLQDIANNSPQVSQLKAFQEMANNSPKLKKSAILQNMVNTRSSDQSIYQRKTIEHDRRMQNHPGIYQLQIIDKKKVLKPEFVAALDQIPGYLELREDPIWKLEFKINNKIKSFAQTDDDIPNKTFTIEVKTKSIDLSDLYEQGKFLQTITHELEAHVLNMYNNHKNKMDIDDSGDTEHAAFVNSFLNKSEDKELGTTIDTFGTTKKIMDSLDKKERRTGYLRALKKDLNNHTDKRFYNRLVKKGIIVKPTFKKKRNKKIRKERLKSNRKTIGTNIEELRKKYT